MSEFASRVSQYPVVEDTCKLASDTYQWAKGNEKLALIFSKLENTAASLASVMKPVLDTSVAQKLDEVACHQLLDRLESICPTLKESSTEDILGPVANRALDLAETCVDCFLPADQHPPQPQDDTTSRAERLSHLKARATHQALCMFHASIERAHQLMLSLTESGTQLSQVLSTASVSGTLNQVVLILRFTCNTAKSIGVPLIVKGLDTAKDQAERLTCQLKESGRLPWLDLQNIVQHLDRLRNIIKEHADVASAEDIELQTLAPANSAGDSPETEAVPVPPVDPKPVQ